MYEFGCSLTAHYRQLSSVADIEKLCSYFVFNTAVDLIELGFNGLGNYKLFLSAYVESNILQQAAIEKTKLNLHLPRRDWLAIGPERIIADAMHLDKLLGIERFIVHTKDFQQFEEYLSPLLHKISVENDDSDFSDHEELVCDINHFLQDGEIDLTALSKCLLTNGSRVCELHFAYLNHEIFGLDHVDLIKQIFVYLQRLIDLRDKKLVFEGTDKRAVSLEELISSLEVEIKIIKSQLNLCLS